jgi:two-component system, chemotaxis family, chemotaxis protein CheY
MSADFSPRVLIVDDDAFVRVVLKDALEGQGYRLLEASDGEEAVAQTAVARPDVVLLDLMMPRQSGLEALAQIRKVHPEGRVVVISSMDSESMVQQALKAGARGFISKPFHPLEIQGAVRQALEAAPEEAS